MATDPVEVIAREIDPDAWLSWGYALHANVQRRNSALRTARAALAALEAAGWTLIEGPPPIRFRESEPGEVVSDD